MSGEKGKKNEIWGYVTYLSDGSLNGKWGTLSPKCVEDGGVKTLLISSESFDPSLGDIEFAERDIACVRIEKATSDWVKYVLYFTDGFEAFVTVPVKNSYGVGLSDGWLAFESWFGAALQRPMQSYSSKQNGKKRGTYAKKPKVKERVKPAPDTAAVPAAPVEKVVTVPEDPDEKVCEDEDSVGTELYVPKVKARVRPVKTQRTDVELNYTPGADDVIPIEKSEIGVKCPKCQKDLSYLGLKKGVRVQCPGCYHKFDF